MYVIIGLSNMSLKSVLLALRLLFQVLHLHLLVILEGAMASKVLVHGEYLVLLSPNT